MVNVLKAREDLGYQLALLSTELTEIFANAPLTPQSSGEASTSTDTGGQRKAIEGDCPVCVMEFNPGDGVIWCKGACGNNIHSECFEQWAKSKPGEVKCVYCRTPWKGDEDSIKRIAKGGAGNVNHEGYINVGNELSLSGETDMSSYHPYWVAREFGHGSFGSLGSDGHSRSLEVVEWGLPESDSMPDGCVRKGNRYVSPRGGVYDLSGEYLSCNVKNPPRHPRIPEDAEWDGQLWISGGDCFSVDGAVVCEI